MKNAFILLLITIIGILLGTLNDSVEELNQLKQEKTYNENCYSKTDIV